MIKYQKIDEYRVMRLWVDEMPEDGGISTNTIIKGYEKLDCDSITIQNSSFYEMVYEAVAEIDNKMYGCIKIVSISLETDFYFEKDIMSVIEKSRNVVSWIIREKEMKNDVKKLMQIK